VCGLQVRWVGFIRVSSTEEYTFSTLAGGLATDKNDRVRLWIDSKLIIDQWSSLATADLSATTSVPVANDYYELDMHYKVSAWGGPFTGITQQSLATACPTSSTKFRLGAGNTDTAIVYTNMYVRFSTGVCAGKWSKISGYSGPLDDAAFTTTGATAISSTEVTLAAGANAEDSYYVGATLIIACAASGAGGTQSVTVTAYVGATKVATTTTIAASCTSALPVAGTASYKVTNYQIKCATLPASWTDGVATSGCTTTTGDAYSLFYGTGAELKFKGGLITTARTVTSSELFVSSNVQGSPFPVNVSCASTDFTSSIIYGGGLTIATVSAPVAT
jgi:hypothetical protein